MTTPFTGTGYTYVQSGNIYTITFNSSGNITFTSNIFSVSYIVVGGGSGGWGGQNVYGGVGGGGGGGGAVSLGSFANYNSQIYTVTVGGGGVGGGGGGSSSPAVGQQSSLVANNLSCVCFGGQTSTTFYYGGYGGHGNAEGINGTGGYGGYNGKSVTNGSLSNNSTIYGGGGGGGAGNPITAQGYGVGGGGNGGNQNYTAVNGTTNTGGGGGGGSVGASGASGGSGVVILFYYSTPETNFITYNPITGITADLNTVFTHYSGGIKAPQTNYTINGVDLNCIFDPSSVEQSINFNTSYIANGLDLRYIFGKLNPTYYYVDRSSSSTVNIRNFGFMSQIACSYDGTYCIAAAAAHGQYGAVFISSNTGQNWTAVYPDGNYTTSPTNWQSCSCSSTGQIMIAGTTTHVYKSTNYGLSGSWTSIYTSSNLRFCASSYDCSYNYMSTSGGQIIYLHGGTGTYEGSSANSNGITTNYSGQYVYYVTNGAGVFYSSNYGQAFTSSTINGTHQNNWAAIKCDNSGQYVYASEVGSETIFYSTDYGHNFNVMITINSIPGSPSNIQSCYSLTCDGTGNVVTISTFPITPSVTTGGGVYQTKNALININNNTPPLATSWSKIGNSTEFSQDTYWLSITSDNNTGQLLVMNTAVEASYSSNGGLYTYNMFK